MGNNQNSKSIDEIGFSRTEVEILKSTWYTLGKIGVAELGVGLMTRILIEHKDLKCMWRRHNLQENNNHLNCPVDLINPNHSIKAHGEKVFNTIKLAINSIDDLSAISNTLNQMGFDHYNFGTRVEHFQIMGESLVSTLSDALKEQWTDQTRKTWIKLFRLIELQMKIGMNRAEAN